MIDPKHIYSNFSLGCSVLGNTNNSKKPNIPSKRKLEVPIHDPSTFYKSTKRDANGTPARTNGRAAQVEDDGLERDEDELAGPSLPPEDGDEDEDEEGGRFFGGGIGGETKEVLDFVDRQDDDADAAPEVIDTSWLRKTALNFERHISKNSELRAKFEDQPEKYVRLPNAHLAWQHFTT